MSSSGSSLEPSDCSASGEFPTPADWIANGGYLLIVAGMVQMFWGMTFVCEEYSVPAITVFCKRNNISDDVAGAIFIGTGLSLPLLFASFVGLFAYDSGIGVGTVVGGNIFNQLLNIAFSIHVAPQQRLRLDALVTTRETLFYLLSCLLIVWAAEHDLASAFNAALRHEQWVACLAVPWYAALALLAAYVFYVLFDAYFAQISLWTTHACHSVYRALCVQGVQYLAKSNSSAQELVSSVSVKDSVCESDIIVERGERETRRTQRKRVEDSNADDPVCAVCVWEEDDKDKERETAAYAQSDWDDIYNDDVEVSLSTQHAHTNAHFAEFHPGRAPGVQPSDTLEDFPLLMKSAFFARHGAVGCFPVSRVWKSRHFSLTEQGLFYRIDHSLPTRGPHVRYIDIFDLEEVCVRDARLCEFSLRLRTHRKSYVFRALSEEVFDAVLARLYEFLEDVKKRPDEELRAMALKSMYELVQNEEEIPDGDDDSVGETAFVVPGTLSGQCWHYFTLPLKLLVFYTTPDVRRAGSERRAVLSTTISFAWLGVMTYVLIAGLTELANLLRINGTVMGLTVAAWAASYPAAWSSIVVARNGYGDIVMCNALGSNVFNNLLGLGLPWMTYIAVHGGRPYSGMQDQGVVLSIVLLSIVMIATYLMIAATNFELQGWMVPVMIVAYFAFIGYFVYFTLTL